MRNMPGNLVSDAPEQEKARKLLRKSGIFEHQVDKPQPHLENQKISSKILDIRKIWEEKTRFENIQP